MRDTIHWMFRNTGGGSLWEHNLGSLSEFPTIVSNTSMFVVATHVRCFSARSVC